MWTGLDGFPAFCTGETVFSVLAEFTKRVHPESNAAWLKELFGNSYQTAITDLASNLYELEQRIPAVYGYDADYMINWHTTAPYHRLGQSESQTQKLYKAMKVKSFNATNVHIYAGNMHSGIRRPTFSRACTICIGVDRKNCGRTYWHREHQLPGIEVCPLHGIYLTEVNLPNTQRHTFVTLEEVLATQAPIEPRTQMPDTRLINLAQDSYYLLTHPEIQVALDKTHQLYEAIARDQGMTRRSGKIDFGGIDECVRNYYSTEILSQFKLSLHPQVHKAWVYQLLTRPNAVWPTIKHLIIIQALGHTVQSVLELKLVDIHGQNPFGNGPWPCLNKAVSHFMEPVITHCSLTRANNRARGEFDCNCGFCYSLTEPVGETLNERNFIRFDGFNFRVIEYGSSWDSALCRMWQDSDLLVKDIALGLGVSSDTVKAQAWRLGLSSPPAGNPKVKPAPPERQRKGRDIRSEYRAKWLKACDENPQATISELSLLLWAELQWLYRYDRGWLDMNKPQPVPGGSRKDWPSRDETLEQLVEAAGLKRRSDLTGPRITVQLLSADIGRAQDSLPWRTSKLPKTSAALDLYVETHEQYAIRRLKVSRAYCIERRLYVSPNQLRIQAGIDHRFAHTPVIWALIEQLVQEIDSALSKG